jgi:hypothetical protein
MCDCNSTIDLSQDSLIVNIEEQYTKNGGNENFTNELDKLIEQYPELLNEKEKLLTIFKIHYCQGFLEEYLEVIE